MVSFFAEPKIQTKEEFLNTNFKDAISYLKEKRNVSVIDEKLIQEFFEKIFKKISGFADVYQTCRESPKVLHNEYVDNKYRKWDNRT